VIDMGDDRNVAKLHTDVQKSSAGPNGARDRRGLSRQA
jgi:hypothetical protein